MCPKMIDLIILILINLGFGWGYIWLYDIIIYTFLHAYNLVVGERDCSLRHVKGHVFFLGGVRGEANFLKLGAIHGPNIIQGLVAWSHGGGRTDCGKRIWIHLKHLKKKTTVELKKRRRFSTLSADSRLAIPLPFSSMVNVVRSTSNVGVSGGSLRCCEWLAALCMLESMELTQADESMKPAAWEGEKG